MIIETWAVLSVLAGGALIMNGAGLRGWGVPALGMLVGASAYVLITLVQVVTPLPTTPVIGLVGVVAIPVAWWLWRWRRGDSVGMSWRAMLVVAALVVALVAILRWARLVTWHGDSVFYVLSGVTLHSGEFYGAMWNEFFEKRPLGVPALHGPAALQNEFYLASLTPLIAAAMGAVVIWVLRRALRSEVPAHYLSIFSVIAVAFLFSSHRTVHHVFYLNGHLLTGAMVLMAAGAGWLLVREDLARTPLVIAVMAGTSTAVLTRAEGALTMVMVLLPLVLAPTVSRSVRRLVIVWLGTVMVVWFGFGLWVSAHHDQVYSFSTAAQFCAGLALVALSPLIGAPWLERHHRRWLWAAEAMLWAAVAALAVRDRDILIDSAVATAVNQAGAGKWGVTVIALSVAVILVTAARALAGGHLLRFPVTTFIPLVLLLAYLREGAYRVGMYDSLNRMWMQVLPLAVLFVVASLASGSWKPWWERVVTRGRNSPLARTARE